ncbi:dendritic cell-specific transmembrane protein [Protobothrops mucrosquamatus]|uniref:dendritic cell-specific transmembrane protein n=1 Tax=Protobothrops mucrosquamatus TaxID=103944 RepID=UPI0010FB92AF|nr:dendritic cell-specific transmembrane protein [Protobothrops mucrosquamatus]
MDFVTFLQQSWELFVTQRKLSWKYNLVLFALCTSISLIANLFLLLPGYSFLLDYPMLSIITVNILWILLSVNLYFFRSLRCFVVVFFLSCGLREGRNTLIAAGTAMVVAGNIQNIFFNLKQLADSVTCTLDSQNWTFLNLTHLKAIRWIYSQLKITEHLFVVRDSLNVSFLVSDENLKLQLEKTRLGIHNITSQISSIIALQSFLGKKVLPFLGTILVLLGTYLFIRNFLSPQTIKFKNTYITRGLIKYNEQVWQQQKISVLPLSKEEKNVYSMVPSFCQTPKERKCTAHFFLPVLANLCIWVLFAAVDYLLYRLIFSVSKHLHDFPELEVHFKLYYHKNAAKFILNNGEIVDKTIYFKMPLFEENCIPKPEISLSTTWIQLGVILFFLIVLGLLTSTLTQLKILVATTFFPSTDMKRIKYLHTKLLNRRSKLSKKNMKRKLNSFAKLHFWFPILQALGNARKKETNVENENPVL